MLDARADPRDDERRIEGQDAARRAGGRVASGRHQSSEDQQQATADAVGQTGGRQLERRHRTGVEAAQQRERHEVEPEFRSPDRQEHVDRICVAVMEGMGEPRQHQRSTSVADGPARPKRDIGGDRNW